MRRSLEPALNSGAGPNDPEAVRERVGGGVVRERNVDHAAKPVAPRQAHGGNSREQVFPVYTAGTGGQCRSAVAQGHQSGQQVRVIASELNVDMRRNDPSGRAGVMRQARASFAEVLNTPAMPYRGTC
jgi:hypothetical protein